MDRSFRRETLAASAASIAGAFICAVKAAGFIHYADVLADDAFDCLPARRACFQSIFRDWLFNRKITAFFAAIIITWHGCHLFHLNNYIFSRKACQDSAMIRSQGNVERI